MKKMLFLSIIFSAIMTVGVSYAKEFRGTSEYYIADLTTKNIAIKFARDKAKRAALEQAGTFVSSLSESTNGLLTKDDIKVVTLGVAKLKLNSEQISYSAPDQNKVVTLSYSAVFDINEKEVKENLNKYKADNSELRAAKIHAENQKNFISQLSEKYMALQKDFEKSKGSGQYINSINEIKSGQNAEECAEIADSFFLKDDYDNALLYYQKELDFYKNAPLTDTNKELQSTALSCIALQYTSKGMVDKAEQTYFEALKITNDDIKKSRIYCGLSSLCSYPNYKGSFEKALGFVNKAIQLDSNEDPYITRMKVYRTYGKWEEAIKDYNKLTSQQHEMFPTVIAADCYSRLGNTKKALELCEMLKNNGIFEKENGFFKAYEYMLYDIQARSYVRNKDFHNAIKAYTKALELYKLPGWEKNNDDYYLYRGACYALTGQYKEAYNDFMMVLAINPNNEDAKNGLKKLEEIQSQAL